MTREALHAVAWLSERYDLGDKLDGLSVGELGGLMAHLDASILKAVDEFTAPREGKGSRTDKTLSLLAKVRAKKELRPDEREQLGELIGTLTEALSETL